MPVIVSIPPTAVERHAARQRAVGQQRVARLAAVGHLDLADLVALAVVGRRPRTG
jgi:hypothetical protein